MYAYRFDTLLEESTPEKMGALIAHLRAVQEQAGSRAADEAFIRAVGLRPSYAFNESYYRDAVDFEIAHLLALAGRGEEASAVLSATPVMMNAGGHVAFAAHVSESLAIHERQQQAVARGMPFLLVNSVPKSGSAALSQTLAELMEAPVARASIGVFPRHALVESWLKRAAAGGMVTHEHFPATPHNLNLLRRLGIRHMALQLRDPRACLWSRLQANIAQKRSGEAVQFERLFEREYTDYVGWIAAWLAAVREHSWLSVRIVRFGEFSRDSWQAVANILSDYTDVPAASALIKKAKAKAAEKAPVASANFNQGIDDAWREHASSALRDALWNALPVSVIETLELTR